MQYSCSKIIAYIYASMCIEHKLKIRLACTYVCDVCGLSLTSAAARAGLDDVGVKRHRAVHMCEGYRRMRANISLFMWGVHGHRAEMDLTTSRGWTSGCGGNLWKQRLLCKVAIFCECASICTDASVDTQPWQCDTQLTSKRLQPQPPTPEEGSIQPRSRWAEEQRRVARPSDVHKTRVSLDGKSPLPEARGQRKLRRCAYAPCKAQHCLVAEPSGLTEEKSRTVCAFRPDAPG